MLSNNQSLGLRQIVSRSILGLIWLSLPISFIFHLSEKVIVCVIIFIGFILFSHSCLTYIHNELIPKKNRWRGYILMLLFGPIEADRLIKINKTTINDIDL